MAFNLCKIYNVSLLVGVTNLPSEVVLSKFHKNTDIKQIYKFLVRLGLKPDQVRMDKKETTQWYKVIVGFKEPAEV